MLGLFLANCFAVVMSFGVEPFCLGFFWDLTGVLVATAGGVFFFLLAGTFVHSPSFSLPVEAAAVEAAATTEA